MSQAAGPTLTPGMAPPAPAPVPTAAPLPTTGVRTLAAKIPVAAAKVPKAAKITAKVKAPPAQKPAGIPKVKPAKAAKAAPKVGFTGMTAKQFANYVNKTASSEFAPSLNYLKSSTAAMNKLFGTEAGVTNLGSQRLAQMYQGIGPVVSQNYTQAAQADAAYAKGFQDTMASVTPGVSPGVGQVLGTEYGLLPAENLTGQGAAFTSAANMLPQTAEGLRNAAVNAISANQAKYDIAAAGKLSSVLDAEAKARISIGNQLQTQARQTYSTQLSAERAAASIAHMKFTENMSVARFNQQIKQQARMYGLSVARFKQMVYSENARLKLSAQRQAFSENIQQKRLNLEAQHFVQSNKLAWTRIGIENQRLQMAITKNELAMRNGGLSATEVSRYRSLADNYAQRMLGPLRDPTGSMTKVKMTLPNGKVVYRNRIKMLPKLSFPEAMGAALRAGVPLQMALATLGTFATSHGVPRATVQRWASQYDSLNTSLKNLQAGAGALPNFGKASYGNYTGNARIVARQLQHYPGLDPRAVLAIASHEGLGGGIGDNGTSFGPFQLHIGGALPAWVAAQGMRYAQAWAWSAAGIDYALNEINKVAHGLRGRAAVQAISSRFERPANVPLEVSSAMAAYGRF